MYSKSGMTYEKRYLDESKGVSLQDIWDDIQMLRGFGSKGERLGYPTQKPVALMERIVELSSHEGDLVADFFCGCGTTIDAAQKLKRKWIGADISHLAVKLISKRLIDKYGQNIRETFEIHGFPKDIASAKSLATETKSGRFKFEEWIIEVMMHGILNENKTQTGFDGYVTHSVQGKKDIVLIEVKSGNANLTQLNHFIQTVDSKKAQAGVFVCFAEQITKGMFESAKKQGYFRREYFDTKFDKIQILTVEDLMDGKQPNLPQFEQTTFKTSKKESTNKPDQGKLF
ncbi:MAG: site-specific DNA-methyltransferase [Bacteroidales bacterium]